MSFSSEVREELAGLGGGGDMERAAQLGAIVIMCGALSISAFDRQYLKIQTENANVVRSFAALAQRLLHACPQVGVRRKKLPAGGGKEKRERYTYTAALMDPEQTQRLLDRCGILTDLKKRLKKDACKKAYLRGAFLVSGSVSDPQRSYHLELVCENEQQAGLLREIMEGWGLDARILPRKERYMVYLKEAEQISDLLGLMGASRALLRFENARILREISGSVNRQVNCETANITKTVGAAVRQMEDIRYLRESGELEQLPPQLLAAARVRLENPEIPLKRLGELMDPPIGKSGMNHRLNRIREIAQEKREALIEAALRGGAAAGHMAGAELENRTADENGAG